MTRDSPRHVATPWRRIKKRLDCVDFHRARGLDTRTPPCSRDREYRRVPAAGAGTSVRLDEPARRSPRASARANAARRSAKTSRARRVGGCRRATTSHSRAAECVVDGQRKNAISGRAIRHYAITGRARLEEKLRKRLENVLKEKVRATMRPRARVRSSAAPTRVDAFETAFECVRVEGCALETASRVRLAARAGRRRTARKCAHYFTRARASSARRAPPDGPEHAMSRCGQKRKKTLD